MEETLILAYGCFAAAGLGIFALPQAVREIWQGTKCIVFGHDYEPKMFASEGVRCTDPDPWHICTSCGDWKRLSEISTSGGVRGNPEFGHVQPGSAFPKGR